jgi:hypothetical protein
MGLGPERELNKRPCPVGGARRQPALRPKVAGADGGPIILCAQARVDRAVYISDLLLTHSGVSPRVTVR